jgi:multimeric flavodoxin WrbA
MNILGLSFGTKLGNNEIMVKEALMAAEKEGAEVGFIRMLDLDIKPCKGCVACVMNLRMGGDGNCSIKDDLPLVDEQVMQADGIIVSAPVYVLAPGGLYKCVNDRWGPSHDMYWRMMAKEIAKKTGKKGPDERAFKKRVGAVMCTGGASTPHWLSLGLPQMKTLLFPLHIALVDEYQLQAGSKIGHVALNGPILERVRQLGKNVVEAARKAVEDVKWMGDEQGTCPVCHSNLLTVLHDKSKVECPICGIQGELSLVKGKISVKFSDEQIAHSRFHIQGLKDHWDELMGNMSAEPSVFMQRQKAVNEATTKYKDYKEIKLK